jgi:hypothetical protein
MGAGPKALHPGEGHSGRAEWSECGSREGESESVESNVRTKGYRRRPSPGSLGQTESTRRSKGDAGSRRIAVDALPGEHSLGSG